MQRLQNRHTCLLRTFRASRYLKRGGGECSEPTSRDELVRSLWTPHVVRSSGDLMASSLHQTAGRAISPYEGAFVPMSLRFSPAWKAKVRRKVKYALGHTVRELLRPWLEPVKEHVKDLDTLRKGSRHSQPADLHAEAVKAQKGSVFEPSRRLIDAISKPNSPPIRICLMMDCDFIACSCRALKYNELASCTRLTLRGQIG